MTKTSEFEAMAKLPKNVIFSCESCGKSTQAISNRVSRAGESSIIARSGQCRQCDGDTWTMQVVYAEDSLDMASFAVDLGAAAVASSFAGVGFTTLVTAGLSDWKTSSNEWRYKNIPGCVIAKLNSEPTQLLQRVADLARTMERVKMFEAGAKDCSECGMIFMPSERKPWNELGYCCRLCAAKAETEEPVFVEVAPAENESLIASTT